jgi:hypothetical protein
MSRRIDWKALESEYMAAGDDVTLESLSSKHGVSLVALSRHAKAEMWEFGQARFRVYMGRPQKTDILKRMRENWDKRFADLFEKAAARKRELEAEHEGCSK